MQIILHKTVSVKSINNPNIVSGQGYILLIKFSDNDTDEVLYKATKDILKLKLWNIENGDCNKKWSHNIKDLNYDIFMISNQNTDFDLFNKLVALFKQEYSSDKIKSVLENNIEFINDGPFSLNLNF